MQIRKSVIFLLLVAAVACNRESTQRAQQKVTAVKNRVADAFDAEAPVERKAAPAPTPQELEKQRFDEQWRQLQSFRAQQAAAAQQQANAQVAAQQQQAAAQQQAAQQAALNIQFVPAGKKRETFKGLDANAINAAPVMVPIRGDVAGPSVLKTQVYLDRNDFSVGALDGRWGKNSAIAVWWYQRSHNLEATGDVDEATYRLLAQGAGGVPALVQHPLSDDDVKGPFVTIPDDVYEKEKLSCLCYETVKEKLAEQFHTTQDFLEQLNPNVEFSSLKAGDAIVVPNVREPLTTDRNDIAKVVVSIAGNTFNAFDAQGNLIFHAPTTLGSKYDPSPNETTKVVSVTRNPHFHYQPTLFHEVPDTDPEAHLQPGPNSPVGVVWMALSKPHFGIHGTSDPESIGYASSHGCVRLANWDALEVSHRISQGVEVSFVDTRKASSSP
jgi:lipoprotein-anchoring transpeptidase ErfK/SrfK